MPSAFGRRLDEAASQGILADVPTGERLRARSPNGAFLDGFAVGGGGLGRREAEVAGGRVGVADVGEVVVLAGLLLYC